jgi:hypothetical protein
MSEFDEKLNAILSNPDSMAQIMQLAQSLSGQEGGTAAPPADTPQTSAPPPPPAGGNPLSALTGGLDPKLLTRLMPVLQELNRSDDGSARQLLLALRPYLRTERQEKVERALQLARLIHIGKKFLAGWEG